MTGQGFDSDASGAKGRPSSRDRHVLKILGQFALGNRYQGDISFPSEKPACIAAVRLLLLTGCRPGKIRRLRWREVKPDRLTLIDTKTGPRHVLLGDAARELLDSLAVFALGEWVFPSSRRDGPLAKNELNWFWTATRDAAEVAADARLYDLRHAHASHAVMNGERLHVAGHLLGHRSAPTTNRYEHPDDATLSQAAERVANAVQWKLIGGREL